MKTTFTRTIDTDSAIILTSGIIDNICQAVKDDLEVLSAGCECSGVCTCPRRYIDSNISKDRVLYSPDHYGAEVIITWPGPDQVEFKGVTCGGYEHTLRIDIEIGRMVVYHDGARRSFPGLLQDFLPQIWGEFSHVDGWDLVEYQTTQPGWAAFAGLLVGIVGDGPENLEDAIQRADSEMARKVEGIFRIVDRPIPPFGLIADSVNNLLYRAESDGSCTPIPYPRWTGMEYRRAAAQGVKLP